mmetsp:Transcript_1111/g.1262  ORF Transcript_1111/g.1262 Transcript_1111/m.1262 type:complete len:528 (+) Transcript_1111:42-1625(+)
MEFDHPGEETDDVDVEALLKRLNNQDASLDTVDLRYKALSEEALQNIVAALELNKHVHTLLLCGNDLGADGTKRLANLLQRNEKIVSVDLRFTELDDEGAKHLIKGLAHRTAPITSMPLLGNQLSSAVSRQLKACIKRANSARRSPKVARVVGNQPPGTPPGSPKRVRTPITTRKAPRVKVSGSLAELREKYPDNPEFIDVVLQMREKIRKAEKAANDYKEQLDNIKKTKDEAHEKTLVLNLKNVQINEKIADSGGSTAGIYGCLVDGWHCVMKELDMRGVNDEKVSKFMNEIKLLERLPGHPNIVRYLFHQQKNDKLRLFMTHYTDSLRGVVRRRRDDFDSNAVDHFHPRDIAKYMVEIVTGLQMLHDAKVIHRDMKTDNIFVLLDVHNEIRQLAIGDFDTAKDINPKKKTSAKTIIGTPCYMAPEVFKAETRGSYTFHADIWSFGMILYELMTLRQPYEDEDWYNIPTLVSEGKRPQIPHEERFEEEGWSRLLAVYEKCTQLKPASRPDSTQLKEELFKINWELR